MDLNPNYNHEPFHDVLEFIAFTRSNGGGMTVQLKSMTSNLMFESTATLIMHALEHKCIINGNQISGQFKVQKGSPCRQGYLVLCV